MTPRGFVLGSLFCSAVLLAAGCASSREWRTWSEHPTHFASGDHLRFSIRNTEGAAPNVTRQDISSARHEGWWGRPVTVTQGQIFAR
jgi:hypothetical protein